MDHKQGQMRSYNEAEYLICRIIRKYDKKEKSSSLKQY